MSDYTPRTKQRFNEEIRPALKEQLGLSNGSLRGLLNRGMNKLREMMQDLD